MYRVYFEFGVAEIDNGCGPGVLWWDKIHVYGDSRRHYFFGAFVVVLGCSEEIAL